MHGIGEVWINEKGPFEEQLQKEQLQLFIAEILRHWLQIFSVKNIFSNDIKKLSPEKFCKNVFPRNFAKFTKKYLCWRLLFDKVAPLMKKSL